MKAIRRALTMSMLAGMTLCALGAVSGLGERDLALLRACANGKTDEARSLLASGANVNAAMSNGATPLLVAAQNGHADTVSLLLASGANFNAAMIDGATPLFMAAQQNQIDAARTLLEAGANVNAAKTNGVTPLYIASKNGQADMVKLLLSSGANVNAAKNGGATPLDAAIQAGHADVAQLLKAAGATDNAAATNATVTTTGQVANATGNVTLNNMQAQPGTRATATGLFDPFVEPLVNNMQAQPGTRATATGQVATTNAFNVTNAMTATGTASGTGTATRFSIIYLSGNLAFGSVPVGSSPAQSSLTIYNTGNSTLTVGNISYPRGFSGSYSGNIVAGGSRSVTVTFTPTSAINYGGAVTVNCNKTSGTNAIFASGTGTSMATSASSYNSAVTANSYTTNGTNAMTATGTASGTGTATRFSIIYLSGNLAFGSVTVGSSPAQSILTIYNTGNSTLTVGNISYPRGFSGSYSGNIVAGGSQPVTVTFTPISAISYGGAVTVNCNKTSGTNVIFASGMGTTTTTSASSYNSAVTANSYTTNGTNAMTATGTASGTGTAVTRPTTSSSYSRSTTSSYSTYRQSRPPSQVRR